jgi:hypothetical protein
VAVEQEARVVVVRLVEATEKVLQDHRVVMVVHQVHEAHQEQVEEVEEPLL